MWWPGPALTAELLVRGAQLAGRDGDGDALGVAGAEPAGRGPQTYLLIANPGPRRVRRGCRISPPTATSTPAGRSICRRRAGPASSELPVASDQRSFSVLVESLGTVPVPIVVEHATYSSPGGVIWASGGNALAAPLP